MRFLLRNGLKLGVNVRNGTRARDGVTQGWRGDIYILPDLEPRSITLFFKSLIQNTCNKM